MNQTKRLILPIVATSALFLGPLAVAEEPAGAAQSTFEGKAQIEPSENLCFGGIEDGKIIVSEQFLENPYRQTTRLGCEVDGGAPVTMPDLPAPDAAKTRLA
ncbi:MAG: hypothetical protein AAGE43_15480 [Pseudomonadota bacterium]